MNKKSNCVMILNKFQNSLLKSYEITWKPLEIQKSTILKYCSVANLLFVQSTCFTFFV